MLYNATHLGGTPPPARKADDGTELIGTSFWATVSPMATAPSHYIVTDVGSPSAHVDACNGRPPPCLRHVRSDELEGPSADIVKRDSTVKETRQWIKESKSTADVEVNSFLLNLEQLPPLEMPSPCAPATILNAKLSALENGGCEIALGNDAVAALGTGNNRKSAKVHFAPTVTYHEPTSDYDESFGSRTTVRPQHKNGRSISAPKTDHPWPSAAPSDGSSPRKTSRERLHEAKIARRRKRIPRRHVLSVLKGRFKPYHLKYGEDVPGAYRFAHAKSKGDAYSEKWRVEESEEVGYLSGLDAFIKGLTVSDLPEGTNKNQVLGTLWAYDAKPKPRARLVADGSQEDTAGVDTFSPVLKMENVKVVLAVIAQERMDLRLIDIKKAFFKGRLHQPCYIWAPEGFATFPGEIWSVQLPTCGLSISSRLFYQCISEFFRSIGMTHFMGDPCLFRRLEGPGIVHPFPEHTDSEDWRRMAPNQRFEGHHVDQLSPDTEHALPVPNVLESSPTCVHSHAGKHYFSIGLLYVDDILIASHDITELVESFGRRFEITFGANGSRFLGFNLTQNPDTYEITITFEDYLDRAVEHVESLPDEEITIFTMVGILQWVTGNIFGSHSGEVKALARRMNLQLPEDIRTSFALLHELHTRKSQGIHFRQLGDGAHVFRPRTSRVEGISDVSKTRAFERDPHEIAFTKADILDKDFGVNVYEDEPELSEFIDPSIPITEQFVVDCWTDATWAPDILHGRSDMMFVVRINGIPVHWGVNRITGIADSSTRAEYCGSSIGVRRMLAVIQTLRFLGIAVHVPKQYIDSTAAKQLAENPKKMGSTRHIGIKWHFIRYHVQKRDVDLAYCITEDMLSDMGTKRLARKKLARFAAIFFNVLDRNWASDPDNLLLITPPGTFPELG